MKKIIIKWLFFTWRSPCSQTSMYKTLARKEGTEEEKGQTFQKLHIFIFVLLFLVVGMLA
jgi:hypothetical protein